MYFLKNIKKIGNDLFHLKNSITDLTINNVKLEDFVSFGYVFNVIDANNIAVNNLKCTVSNSTSQNRTMIFHSTGGCLRTIDVLYRNFENVKILDSFSNKTAYGIIIKDNHEFAVSNITKVKI